VERFTAILCAALALCAGTVRGGLLPSGAFSDDARGTTAAGFVKVPPSARIDALAGCGLALRGADSFFLNPAGTLPLSGPGGLAASVSYESLLEGASRTGLVLSAPRASGAYSAGLIYHDASAGLQNIDGAGTGSGTDIPAYDAAFGAGWARSFGGVDLGVAVKYLRSRLADASGSAYAADAGVIFRESPGSATEYALAVRNIGTPMKLGSEKAPLPAELGGGFKWHCAPDVDLFMEGRMPADHSPYLAFAGEWSIAAGAGSGFAVRGGLNFKNYSDQGFMGAFAGGFGLKLGGFSLDYAFTPYGDLGAAHRMTAGWAWGGGSSVRAAKKAGLPRGTKLSVAPFSSGDGVTAAEAEVARSMVESELAGTGAFRPVDRNALDFILAEKRTAYAGLSEDRTAAELARLAGAGAAVSGGVTRGADGYRVYARLLDASSGDVLRSASAVAREDYLFRDAARRLAAELAGK
jgi:TolB-like protein